MTPNPNNGLSIPIIRKEDGGRGPKGVLVSDVPPNYDPQSAAGQSDGAGAGPKHEPLVYSADPLCNPELIKKGQEILGNYLLKYFEKSLPSSPVKPQAEEFLKRIGPFVLYFEPSSGKMGFNYFNYNNVSLVDSISIGLVGVLLNIEAGTAIDGKMFDSDNDGIIKLDGAKMIFPEFGIFNVMIKKYEFSDTIFSPFHYVMSLSPDYRALCAVAVKKGLEEKCLAEYSDEQRKDVILADCPGFRHFASACQENGISLDRLPEILQKFKDVHKIYEEKLK